MVWSCKTSLIVLVMVSFSIAVFSAFYRSCALPYSTLSNTSYSLILSNWSETRAVYLT